MTAPFLPRLRHHFTDLLRLAWPVMLSRAGILIMAFCDIAMLGRYGGGEVGVSNLGLSIFVPALVVTIGLTSGMVPVISQAFGAGHWEECGRAWRRAMVWGAVLSLFGIWLTWQGGDILLWLGAQGMGPTVDLAQRGGAVAQALAPGLLAQVLFAVCAFYLESTRRPRFAMLAMLVANLLNLALNWVFIFGHLGVPEMGAVGAAIASTLARFAALGLMLWYIFSQAEPRAAGVTGPWETFWGPGGWRAGWPMRKLGFSAGVSNGFETVGFASMSLFAGRLGSEALDAYSISHNMVSTLFMVGLGLAIATGVRVGIELGKGRPEEASFAGWTGLLAALVIMGGLGLAVCLLRDQVAWIYTDDPVIQARVAGIFLISAFVFLPDTAQIVMGQAVRALGDAWVPILCYGIAFTVLMIPMGWVMVEDFGWDERGLVISIITACLLATVTLAWRFHHLTIRG
ncbi:MAG: MATE family efflux transporter [Pseudomonadota bacterium]